ncbi:MAG: 4-hydroxy-tetrahydrodipicolinate reductase, partial [Pontimonas sp.]
MSIRVAVVGATGRLGSQVAAVVESMPDMELVARLDSRSELADMLGADVAVDVTLPGVS